jgi:multiple sugar transport system ATP-binding protein
MQTVTKVMLKDVTKKYDDVVAVNNISLDIYDGEFLVLLGPSGSGKTTLLRLLAGLEELTEGQIYIEDTLVNDLPPRHRNIAMVFQNYALYPHMSVFENLAYPLKIRKHAKEEIRKRVNEVAENLKISELLNRKPKQISGGQKQRVALGRAMIRQANLFLMDEPLSNLDAKLRVQMRAEYRRLQKSLKATTVYVTHDQAEAMTLADRVAIVNYGEIRQLASPDEIYFQPADKFVAGFVGSPQMNFFVGLYKESKIITDHFEYSLIPEVIKKIEQHGKVEKVYLGVRPEDVYVSKTKSDGAYPAKVYVSELMGPETFVFFTLCGDETFMSKTSPDFKCDMDEDIFISLNDNKVHVFDFDTEKALT